MTTDKKDCADSASISTDGLERRPLPGGLRLTVTERCELYDWKDACVADEVARALAAERERWQTVGYGIVGSFGRARAKWVEKLTSMLRSNKE